MIAYIFEIGIVFITFHILWWLFLFLIKQIVGGDQPKRIEQIETMLKPISLVILTALAAVKSIEFIEPKDAAWVQYVYMAVGAFLLYSYLLEKMRKGKAKMKVVNGRIQVERVQQSGLDKIILYSLVGLFFLFTIVPTTVTNPFTTGLGQVIKDIYDTPIIGWVIGFMGVFFLIRMIFMGIITIGQMVRKVTPTPPPNDPTRDPSADSDGFVDYEIIEDEDEEPENRGNLLE